MKETEKVVKNTEETRDFASAVANKVRGGGVVCLYGNLGSGKTTFTKGIAWTLGLDDFTVKSPTYTYIRKYGRCFYHIDLYRLEEVDELLLHEIEELWEDDENIVVIEWADRMGDYLLNERIDVEMEYVDEKSRKIKEYDRR